MAKFLFREIRDGRPVSMQASHHVVDIVCNDSVASTLNETDSNNDDALFCVHWEFDSNADFVLSSLTLQADSEAERAIQKDAISTVVEVRTLLCEFIEDVFRSLNAQLVAVKVAPLTFILKHGSKEEVKSMAKDQHALQSVIKQMFSGCGLSVPNMKLRVKVLPTTKPICCGTHNCAGFDRRGSTQSSTVENGTDTGSLNILLEDADDGEIGKKFSFLEIEMSRQRLLMEEQTQQQKLQYEEMRNTISVIVESLKKDKISDPEREKDIPSTQPEVKGIMKTKDDKSDLPPKDVRQSDTNGRPAVDATGVADLPKEDASDEEVKVIFEDEADDSSSDESSLNVETGSTHSLSSDAEAVPIARAEKQGRTLQQTQSRVVQRSEILVTTPAVEDKKSTDRHETVLEVCNSHPEVTPEKPRNPMMEVLQQMKKAVAKQRPLDKIWECVDDALMKEKDDLSSVTGVLHTILCIDTSGSVGSKGSREVQDLVLKFIEGVEEIAEEDEIEENVGIVTFGSEICVQHWPSNDYSSLRDVAESLEFEGQSPLHQGILVSVTALARAIHNDKTRHRVIVFTDGLATDAGVEDERDSDVTNLTQQDRKSLAASLTQLRHAAAKHKSVVPLTWVPVGNSNMKFLKDLTIVSNGKLTDSEELSCLITFQKSVVNQNAELSQEDQDVCMDAPGDTALGDEKAELDRIRALRETSKLANSDPKAVDTFNNVFEVDGLPALGTRVVRGLDWQWGDQDGGRPGTIINHGIDKKTVWVLWDNGSTNRYRFGRTGCLDIEVAQNQTKLPSGPGVVDIGMTVNAEFGGKEGASSGDLGASGTVIRKKGDTVLVRWSKGAMREYRGYITAPVMTNNLEAETKPKIAESGNGDSGQLDNHKEEEAPARKTGDWEWRDEEGDWQPYSPEQCERLNIAYNRRKDGTCLLERDGQSFRVSFKSLIERAMGEKKERQVRRVGQGSIQEE